MRNKKKLILDQLDRRLYAFKSVEKLGIPDQGWIYTIRESLGMTLAQLGKKLGMTRQGVKGLEEREAKGSISLNGLKKVGNALDMKLVYGFSSRFETLEEMVEERAQLLANKIVQRTHQQMMLEDQATSKKNIENAVEELIEEYKREMPKSLWD